MTQLTHLQIDGFKTIKELEVEPTQINLITGRNNSGKTSLLESIDLSFNPKNVSMYEENAQNLVHFEEDYCSIEISYKEQQTRITDYTKEAKPGLERNVGLREPTEREVIEILYRTLSDILELNEEYPLSPSPLHSTSIEDQDEGANLDELMRDKLQDNISNLSEEELLTSGASENILILQVDGDEYPFIYLGEYYDRLKEYIINQSIRELVEEIDSQDIDPGIENRIHEQDLERSFYRLLTPRFGKARFVGEKPPSLSGADFIRRVNGSAENFDLDQENSAVRMAKIEQYLKENDIIKGLQDFSFDKVVIKEPNQEPYEVPYEFLGKGVKIVIRVLWALFDDEKRGNILLLEEPENHMHPGYIENLVGELIDISKNRGIQLFITTHNLDLINAFFSPQMKGQREQYIEEEFSLIQMTDPIPKVMNYEEARQKTDELDLDLRGV